MRQPFVMNAPPLLTRDPVFVQIVGLENLRSDLVVDGCHRGLSLAGEQANWRRRGCCCRSLAAGRKLDAGSML